MWKDYSKEAASSKREYDFQQDYPNFVIEDNDVF